MKALSSNSKEFSVKALAHVLTKVAVIPVLAASLILVACSNGGGPAPKPTGNFSNANLNGQYTYRLTGIFYGTNGTAVPYAEAGVFSANGSGTITSGTDDFVQSGSAVTSASTTGNY